MGVVLWGSASYTCVRGWVFGVRVNDDRAAWCGVELLANIIEKSGVTHSSAG